MQKTVVGLIFGGRSGEHEVSIRSAASVYRAIDREQYTVRALGIKKDGSWVLVDDPERVFRRGSLADEKEEVAFVLTPGSRGQLELREGKTCRRLDMDIAFPLVHGSYGEDGSLQGLLEMLGLPYVGAGVSASAVGMDKEFSKRVFRSRGLPVVDYEVLEYGQDMEQICSAACRLGYPVFVKPANLGSSVGISRVADASMISKAVDTAFDYDRKILIEKAVEDGRELECAVLGNHSPRVSIPGEIVPCNEYYDYEAKYIDQSSELIIPAELEGSLNDEIRMMSEAAFQAIGCRGMARVDFLYSEREKKLYINEINTLPGFTEISMYPKLWIKTGLSYSELIDRLIVLGRKNASEKDGLRTDYHAESKSE